MLLAATTAASFFNAQHKGHHVSEQRSIPYRSEYDVPVLKRRLFAKRTRPFVSRVDKNLAKHSGRIDSTFHVSSHRILQQYLVATYMWMPWFEQELHIVRWPNGTII